MRIKLFAQTNATKKEILEPFDKLRSLGSYLKPHISIIVNRPDRQKDPNQAKFRLLGHRISGILSDKKKVNKISL
ncbi:hypothetical protein [Campylobacter curvus]|uniref:hypothetical protein n=1 Tax=Campylobacter curvus TaxID=200 RepID=UPI0014615456|nr:hypothetical protein [Campylobacter curvus]UEB49279.1 hypothetical protein LK426_06520 [Campylobacter curvus]